MTVQVPHLTTALTGPLHQLEQHLLFQQITIEAWLRNQWHQTPPPFYASVDLRNAGFKLAPVDTNLFPAGFNNLNNDFLPLCIQATQSVLDRDFPGCLRILLIPESHTRNLFYLENLAHLQTILISAGFDVRIGSLREDLVEAETITLPSSRQLHFEPIVRQGTQLSVADFTACIILLNNDLSSGIPPILQGLTQSIIPPLALGWSLRSKSRHFYHYEKVCREFAELIDTDPWLINPFFDTCHEVNFLQRKGEEDIAQRTDAILANIQKKYDEYHINCRPFVVVKADNGTYGMGIITVHSGDEIRQLNRKERTRMSSTKGNQTVTRVLIQEGVYTFETLGQEQAVAEPVVYMIGQHVVGGFYRVHKGRGINENLNAPGMHFEPLAFAEHCNLPDQKREPGCNQNRFYAYGVIARLALVAAAREMAEAKAAVS